MSRTRLIFFVLTSVTVSYSAFATAEAARPFLTPPIAIKPTRAQMPMPLSDALKNKTVGLEFESGETVKTSLKQAKDYIAYRNGGWSKKEISAWDEACEAGLNSKVSNPFCRIEQERALSGGRSGLTSKLRAEKRALRDDLRDADFAKADGKSFSEVAMAVGSLGDVDSAILPLARKVADLKTCVPGTVSSALGYKIEERFPDKETIELAKTLYRKSISCGKDYALANAAFRLGLILIWQKQYAEIDELMKKVESVPEASMLHARATFWRYQAAVTLGNEKLKAQIKESLAKNHPLSFQNLVANGEDEVIMKRVMTPLMPSVFTRSLVRPDVNPVLRAAESLERAGSPQLAAEILDRSVNDIATIEPEVRLYAAAFLNRIGYSLTKFKILSSLFADSPQLVTSATMELMFPLSYVDVVRRKQAEIDPLLFLSLMRQESAFNPVAQSGVGARGLMQLMPATARGIRRVSKAQLFQPEINIEVGTKYFLNRLAQYSGDVELTLAAYNAGFARVDQWLHRYPTDNKLLFLDFIPFRETRDYVSSILRNYYWYVRLYAPDTSSVALGSGRLQPSSVASTASATSPVSLSLGKMQSILAANAGDAARLVRAPAAVAPQGN